MLTYDELATVRAALLFWEEEMCPHGEEVGQHYLDAPITESLSAKEVADMRARFTSESVRYALYEREQARLTSTELFVSAEIAVERAKDARGVATVFLPNAP